MNRRDLIKATVAAAGIAMLGRPARLFADEALYSLVEKPAFRDSLGLWELAVTSPCQRGKTVIRILPPTKHDPDRVTRVVYLLPVEEDLQDRWGDPFKDIREKKLQDELNLICVYPTFDTLPWFGRHATDLAIRHELFMTRVVVPLIESLYRTPGDPSGRLLLGFSKSGFGAVSLLLRNPEVFGFAGSWDAPLMMEPRDLGLFGTKGHFGDADTFSEYLPTRLLDRAADDFRKRSRLVIAGEDSFGPNPPARFKDRPHTESFHRLLDAAGIKHVYNNDLKVKHHWNTGWVEPVLRALAHAAIEEQPKEKKPADAKAIEGTWIVIALEVDGGIKPAPIDQIAMIVTPDTITVMNHGREQKLGYKLDATTGTIQLTRIEENETRDLANVRYVLEGEWLTVAYLTDNPTGPTPDNVKPGKGKAILMLKRKGSKGNQSP